jgi:hypothetical protein
LRIVFEQKYWAIILIISILIALGLTLLLYLRNNENKDLTRSQKSILMSLRFLTILFVMMLFTSPLLRTIMRISEMPVVVLATDNSLSMKGLPGTKDPTAGVLTLTETVSKELAKKFRVIHYIFGEKTLTEEKNDFGDKYSDYSQMIQTVFNNHLNENVGALVIIGDGKYNQGENPLNAVKMLHFPVFAVGIGDTSSIRDARISDLRVNKTAFAGNQFPVEVDIRIAGLENSNLLFSVSHRGKKEFSRELKVSGTDYFITIPLTLDATQNGLQYYTATIDPAKGEQNTLNNSWSFVINIMENKQKIMILSEGAHPDVGALINALEQQINYDVSVFAPDQVPNDFKGVSLFILNQLPSSSESCQQIMVQSQKYRIPVLFIVGSKTMLPQLRMLGLGVEVVPLAGEFDEAQATLNDQFVSFTISNELKENLGKYPPLKVPFAEFSLDADYKLFAFQRVKNITTSKPLIAFTNRNGIKTGIIFGEGIWRWRIYNFILSGDHQEFNEWVDKLVQYLALHDNDDNFIIDFKPVYNETENIKMSAEVYNDAFELINTPEVNIEITDSTNRAFSYNFDHSNQFYRMDAGIFPPGKYHFKAKTTIGTADYSETGDFAVVPVNLEQVDYQADYRILNQMAYETNGKFFTSDQSDQLIQSISETNSIKTTNYIQTALNEILNLRWIFFLILLLLSAEWFLRKFWGIY